MKSGNINLEQIADLLDSKLKPISNRLDRVQMVLDSHTKTLDSHTKTLDLHTEYLGDIMQTQEAHSKSLADIENRVIPLAETAGAVVVDHSERLDDHGDRLDDLEPRVSALESVVSK